MKTFTYKEIVNRYGYVAARRAMESAATPTSRLIYPAYEPEHSGKHEWAGEPVRMGNDTVTAYYYLTPEDEECFEDFDWESNVEFQIDEY